MDLQLKPFFLGGVMKESGMSLCKYLFFQFEIIIYALICSSANNLYVYCQYMYYIHMVTNFLRITSML